MKIRYGDKKNIVISAINIVESGTLAILTECLSFLSKELADRYNLIALVNNKARFKIDNNILFYDFPDSKKSWVSRLYYEYFYFNKLSLELRPYLWLSMHDMTPNVHSKIRAVYCHHPSPFYKLSFRELALDPLFCFFHFSYKYLYAINIRKNDFVIVQQNCLKKKFEDMFRLRNVVVAHPEVKFWDNSPDSASEAKKKFIFFYPSLPRIFKNFEVICEAVKLLSRDENNGMEVCLTINGTENIYAKHIRKKYGHLKSIKFLGAQPRERVFEFYKTADCLVFPSKIETWGMPITEFKIFKKPILLADMEYARETLGRYDKAAFFDPDDPAGLAGLMKDFMAGRLAFDGTQAANIGSPFASNWKELFDILLGDTGENSCLR